MNVLARDVLKRADRSAGGRLLACVLTGLVLLFAACAPPGVSTTMPRASTSSAAPPKPISDAQCPAALQTYDPLPALPPSAQITDEYTRKILDRGFLIVGVSADTMLLGARNPLTGQIEGFDIDQAHAVAQALFGDPNKLRLRVITAADRVSLLQSRQVDLVARAMTMTCDRWKDIAFSAEYYQAGQKVLVRTEPNAPKPTETLADLSGKKVCAPAGTSSYDRMSTAKDVIPVSAATHTECLMLFQQGKVDAITGDDTVLAGLAVQDPYAAVTSAPAISSEPYGLGFNKADRYLVSYVNRVLAQRAADGAWTGSYNRWLAATLGPAPAPPAPVYGRS